MEPKWLWLSVLLLLLGGYGWHGTDACWEDERIALLQLKPFFNRLNYLNSWEEEVKGSDCCQWERVECNAYSSSRRVIGLSLNYTRWSYKERWYLNASLFLPFKELKRLYLPENNIAGFVESGGFAKLNLEILDLSDNYLNDTILLSLSRLSSLKDLNLAGNLFTGSTHANGKKTQLRLTNLKELDLSSNLLRNSIFSFLWGFSSLKSLCMRRNQLQGSIDVEGKEIQLRMTNLEVLDLSNNLFKNDTFAFLSGLPSLKSLYMRDNQLQGSIDIQDLSAFTNLEELDMSYNDLNEFVACKELHVWSNVEEIFLDRSYLNNNILQSIGVFTFLKTLSLYECGLIGSLPNQGWCDLRNLESLDISGNALEGILPYCLGNLTSLLELDISYNQFTGNLTPLANLSSLRFISLSRNRLQISMPFLSLANLPNLKFSSVMKTRCGTVPLWLLENNTKLENLFLLGNSFTGPLLLPQLLLPNVSSIDISNNKLQGQIPTNVCLTFPNLDKLFLSKNAFKGNIPHCLSGMDTLSVLDLSDNHLSGRVPEKLIMKSSLNILRLSNNNLSGKIVPMMFNTKMLSNLYLDGNHFAREIPDIDVSATFFSHSSLEDIDLSNNSFNGKLPRWIGNVSHLKRLALSNNHFEGFIPMELCNLYELEFLELSQNNLSGAIPSCFSPPYLRHVHLKRNRLSGPLTLDFNSSSLVTLDLRGNNLIGNIPKWIDTFFALSVLLLKDNHLDSEIPVQLCKLYSLSIIDLSENMFSGPIPSCLGNLTLAMKMEKSLIADGWYGIGIPEDVSTYMWMILPKTRMYPNSYMEEWIEFTTKSMSYSYGGDILEYMSGIDLSFNRLTGQIPFELGNLSEIHSLNLSHNNLVGVIPSSFSQLKQIESLDLSYNNLSGRIPIQLVELNFLEVFSVAHNNLSGSTPEPKAQFGTFNESSYEGNPLLCGPPMQNHCSKSQSPPTVPTTTNNEGEGFLLADYSLKMVVKRVVDLVTQIA
ncbi:receptor-like protein 12 [Durio zibethinus]|uniref:Receptor-like protein 12 n=1 Tax=Durio zibethinus TaxID=66656 RepID=A0A6P5X216_DURZI|nr:receptor-like protein 12 [Durio zibethinus]